MWCTKCQAEVAAMVSPDNERLYCTTCNLELPRPATGKAASPAPSSPKKSLSDPRELLARWAREDSLGSLDGDLPGESIRQENREPIEAATELRRRLRFDASHTVLPPQVPVIERIAATAPAPSEKSISERLSPTVPISGEPPHRELVVHGGHPINPPHFIAPPVPEVDKSSKWVTLVGQIFAYVGVGGLTIGSVLVLMGYFGGPPSYATTGWLVTTAGQMLLFLGVITLVSGGMEQTTQEVARRIDTIGERLIRIEAAWKDKPAPPSRPDADAA